MGGPVCGRISLSATETRAKVCKGLGLASEAAAVEEDALLGAHGAAEHGVSMWKAAEFSNDFTVFDGILQIGEVAGLGVMGFEQGHRHVLVGEILGMHERHVEKDTQLGRG